MSERRRLLVAAVIGALFAIAIIGASSHFDVDRMTFGDGLVHRYVAEHLAASPSAVSNDLEGHGTAIRYARIGLPAILWSLSGGSPAAMRYVQPLLMILAAAAVAAATRALWPSAGLPASLGPFAAVGFTASVVGGFAEPVAVAFALWAVVLARRSLFTGAACFLAAAMLTRENAVGIVAGLLLWYSLQRRTRAAAVLCTSLVPVAVWHAVVGARFGFLPLRDPWLSSQSDTVGFPVVALWRSLTRSSSASVTVILIHLALAALAVTLWRSSDMGAAAAVSGLQVLWAGPFAWRYIGDAVRLMAFVEVFMLLVLLDKVSSHTRARLYGSMGLCT